MNSELKDLRSRRIGSAADRVEWETIQPPVLGKECIMAKKSVVNTIIPPDCTTNQSPLLDSYGRRITYLRLAVTDRCNLRCRYCMPAQGIPFIHHNDILRFEELERLVRLFAAMGIGKVRLTGGEPFVRKGLKGFVRRLVNLEGIEGVFITTNGVATSQHLVDLKEVGLAGINLSMDTLDRKRYWAITRRDALKHVQKTLYQALALEIPVKLNMVVLEGYNEDDILPMAELTRTMPISVRFIEWMPFSGQKAVFANSWTGERIVTVLQKAFPNLTPRDTSESATARLYRVPGFVGTIGIISGFSRKFCSQCNKVRITPQGMLQTCLYDTGSLDLRKLLRGGATDDDLVRAVVRAVAGKPENGFVAEMNNSPHATSMASIGG